MKSKSFLLKRAAAVAAFFVSVVHVSVAQDVQVLLRPKMDPMPPQVMNYIGNPGNYFEVSLTNTSSEVQNVFLTMEVSKQAGGELSVTTPYYIQPNKAITLVPGRLTTIDQVTMLGQFRQLLPKDITLKGAEVSDFYDNGVIGLLPEGTYQAHVKVYQWDPAVKYPQLVSDPLQGKCTFSVCYNASAPEILVPLYNSLELSQNAVGTPKPETPGVVSDANDAKWHPAILDPTKAQFVWSAPVINCGGKVRSYKYQLDIFPIGTAQTTAEEAVATGTIAKTVKNLVAPQCIISEAEVTQMKKFSPTGYFVARVTATPTVTDKANADYSTIENNGHSQLLVFRLKQEAYDKGGSVPVVVPDEEESEEEEIKEEKKEEDKKVEVDPGYKEPEKNDDKKYVYYPPKLTAPAPFKGNVIKADNDIKLQWEKPEKKSGGNEAMNFTYNVKVFKKKVTQSIEEMLETEPIFEEKSLSATNYTLRWDDIKGKVKLSDNLVVAVVPVCLNEASIGYEDDERNLYRGSYVSAETGKLIDCDPDAAKEITNRTLARFNEKEIRDMEVMCGKFPLTIQSASLVEGKHYKGTGFITWKPMGDGLPFQINVTFDELYINSDKVVYDGEVVSAKEEDESLNDYIPYDMFDDLFLADLIGAGTAEAYGEKLFEYIENDDKMAKYCKYAREAAPILDDIIKQRVSVNLPVSLTKLIPTCPVDIQIMSGRWSATNASVSIIGMFALNTTTYTDSQVAVFGLPRLCIEPDSFVPSGATIALLSDFSIKDPETKFVFTLKAPSDLQQMEKDGCTLSFNKNGFQKMHFEADMEIPGLIKADEKGERVRGERPHIDIQADIEDWDNWWGKIKMDNFEVEEAPGFTFCPSGEGLMYDHSAKENVPGFKFPEPMKPAGGIDKNFKPLSYDKTQLGIKTAKEEVKWQGLYLDKIGVWLPPIFKQGDGNNRIEVAMKQFLWDDSGVSLTITAGGTNGGDLVGIETGKLGGWGISLHEVGVSVVQNNFGCTYFTGMVKAPLIGGKWNYSTSFDKIDKGAGGSDLRILFHMQPEGDPEFDFFLAKVNLDEKYTHLDVQYTHADKETKVELEMAGHITIAGTEELTKKLDFNIPGIAFTGMRVANFERPKESNNRSDAQTMKFSHTFDPICEGPNCWFEMGTWGLASAEKTLGPFKFSLDNFGVANKSITEKDKTLNLTGVNIVGTIGLVGDVFSATAGVTIWAQIDMNKMEIDYYDTTLDKIGLSTEFGGCKVAGMLEFVDKDENGTKVKGYGGTLEFNLPGGLFKLQAAGGFFNASDKDHGKFSSAYFLAGVGGATGIPIGPVQLNDISGGFFFHTALDMKTVEANEGDVTKWKTSVKYGVHGGMFGLGIATAGTDRGLNAKVRMTVLYDAVKNRLSTFRMTGEMHALCAPGADDGMINAKCCIVYQNLPTNEGGKFFQINITADAGGDMDKMYEQFTGQKFVMPECVGDLQEMRDQGDKKSKDAEDTKPKVSCGVNITIDFKVTMKADDAPADFKPKWHLYVGQPGDGTPTSMMKDRCSITFIDFQLGGKKDKVAAWCKIWANAYLCVGNELPNNGELPPIPQEVDEFLNGSKKNSSLTESGQNKSAEANQKRKQAVSQFDGAAKSGVMFGASVGGDFGVRAVICYAQATLLAGFDVVLKQLEDAQCNGKPAGGKGGFYGMGQVYAMAQGEMGLIIDIWIYKGDWSLISVGVGALLRGGFPNPSWMYGKVKAKCKLFGGLIKFTGSLTFEIGDVCFPDAGNPLDDIKIFEDMTPGQEHTGSANATPEGWKEEAVSVYAPAGFTTNMKIGARLDLVDENTANRMAGKDGDPADYAANAIRSYKFYVEPTGLFESWSNTSKANYRSTTYSYRSNDQETFEYIITGGMLEANRYYKVTQKGYAKEIRNGREVDPVFNDESTGYKDKNKPWKNEIIRYFRTGPLPNNLNQDVIFTLPSLAAGNRLYKNEMKDPRIHLRTERGKEGDDIFNTSKYDIVARFEKFVDGNWVPADAKYKLDTYSFGSTEATKNYYLVDANGNVDYTTKVDGRGNVIATQCDPFADKKKTLYGVNIERLQRFTAEMSAILQEGSKLVSESNASYYFPIKWIPEDLNSLLKEIEYYQAIMNVDKNKNGMSKLITAMNTLKTNVTNSTKSTYPYPTLDDMRYVYQNTISEKSSIYNQYYMLVNNSLFKTYFERSMNDQTVMINSTRVNWTRKNMKLKDFKEHLDTLANRKSRAMSAMVKAFQNGPGSSRLNEMKPVYVMIDASYELARKQYGYAQTITSNYESAKKERDSRKDMMTYIRNPKYSIALKKNRLETLEFTNKNNFDRWRKYAVDNYHEYYVTKQLIAVCDAFADSVTALRKYFTHLENEATAKTKATELENLLKQVNAYMDKTPEASRSYSYVKSNYYSKAITAFDVAQKATNNGGEFERAKKAYNAIEAAIFSSEKMTLDYAKEQKNASNTAFNKARTAANDALTAANNVLTEENKTSSTNDNAAKVQSLRDIEQTKFAAAYNAANDVADIAADVQRYTARHTGEMNKTPAADQMRQLVKDCRTNADGAMQNYKNAVNKATGYRVKRFTNTAINAFYNLRSTITRMMSETNTTMLNSYYTSVQNYAKTIDEALTSANDVKSDHIYTYLIRDIKELVGSHFKNAAYYLRRPSNESEASYVANYLHGAAMKARNFAASTNPALQDYFYADYMAIYAEAASKLLKDYSDKRTALAKSNLDKLASNRSKVSNNLYNMRYYTGQMLTEDRQSNLDSRFNTVKSLFEELKTLAQNSSGIDNSRLDYVQISNDRALASYYYNAAMYLKERKGSNANYMVNVASNLCNAAESARGYAAATASNVQDATYASHMATIAEDANKHIKGYTFNASLNSSQRSNYNSYKSRAASAATAARTAANNKKGKKYVAPATTAMYLTKVNEAAEYAKKAREEANKKKGKSLTMDEAMPTATSPSTPLYAEAQYRSTVPGVAEAYELMEMETPNTPSAPETPETPDGPAGAAVVAKVAGMMNASMPKPKPKPEIPAGSVINNASAMLNGGASGAFTPSGMTPTVPDVPSTPDVNGVPAYDPYSTATSTLKSSYTAAGKTAHVTSNTSGAFSNIDQNSIANSKMGAIPVTYVHSSNVRVCHWLRLNVDMYETMRNDMNHNYRIVIMQVDKQKFKDFQIANRKETETTTEKANLDSSNKSFLSSTSKADGANSTSDSYNLQAYMSNYYQEMQKQGLEEAISEEEKNKLEVKKAKASIQNFTNEIYTWNINNFTGATIYESFASWANTYRKPDGTAKYSSSKYYLDSNLEGLRATSFAYYNSTYSPSNLAGYSDSYLMDLSSRDFVLKDPYVWLAYMGGFALFNGRKVDSKSGYWDAEWTSPRALSRNATGEAAIWMGSLAAPYVKHINGVAQSNYSIPYTNAGFYVTAGFKNGKLQTTTNYYYSATDLIETIAMGMRIPSRDECLAKKITNSGSGSRGRSGKWLFTPVEQIENVLESMHEMSLEIQRKYNMLYDKSKSTIKTQISTWKSANTMLGSIYGGFIRCPAYQVGFVYQAKWLNDNDKGFNEFSKYFSGYSNSRYDKYADQVALSISNYTKATGRSNFRFDYTWYCNNLKSVTQEYYRCNAYRTDTQEYVVLGNTESNFTKTMTWSDPLKGYGSNFTWPVTVQPIWK